MRLLKYKCNIYSGPENLFNYSEKGMLLVEDDTLSENMIIDHIENNLLSKIQRENRMGKIEIKFIPILKQ